MIRNLKDLAVSVTQVTPNWSKYGVDNIGTNCCTSAENGSVTQLGAKPMKSTMLLWFSRLWLLNDDLLWSLCWHLLHLLLLVLCIVVVPLCRILLLWRVLAVLLNLL